MRACRRGDGGAAAARGRAGGDEQAPGAVRGGRARARGRTGVASHQPHRSATARCGLASLSTKNATRVGLSHSLAIKHNAWLGAAPTRHTRGALPSMVSTTKPVHVHVRAWLRLDAGQHNINQRIQHHQKVKEENNQLKAELFKLRDDHTKQAARCDCMSTATVPPPGTLPDRAWGS
jgi:hypothetical protein